MSKPVSFQKTGGPRARVPPPPQPPKRPVVKPILQAEPEATPTVDSEENELKVQTSPPQEVVALINKKTSVDQGDFTNVDNGLKNLTAGESGPILEAEQTQQPDSSENQGTEAPVSGQQVRAPPVLPKVPVRAPGLPPNRKDNHLIKRPLPPPPQVRTQASQLAMPQTELEGGKIEKTEQNAEKQQKQEQPDENSFQTPQKQSTIEETKEIEEKQPLTKIEAQKTQPPLPKRPTAPKLPNKSAFLPKFETQKVLADNQKTIDNASQEAENNSSARFQTSKYAKQPKNQERGIAVEAIPVEARLSGHPDDGYNQLRSKLKVYSIKRDKLLVSSDSQQQGHHYARAELQSSNRNEPIVTASAKLARSKEKLFDQAVEQAPLPINNQQDQLKQPAIDAGPTLQQEQVRVLEKNQDSRSENSQKQTINMTGGLENVRLEDNSVSASFLQTNQQLKQQPLTQFVAGHTQDKRPKNMPPAKPLESPAQKQLRKLTKQMDEASPVGDQLKEMLERFQLCKGSYLQNAQQLSRLCEQNRAQQQQKMSVIKQLLLQIEQVNAKLVATQNIC